MKLGISTLPRKYGKDRYKMLKDFGFDCHDFQMANTNIEPYTLNEEGFAAYLSEERRLADEAGIRINQLHGPWQWPLHDSTEEERAERLDKMKRACLAASMLGAEYMIIHPIMPHGIEERANAALAADTFRINVEFMCKLALYAAEVGVTVCLENMPFPKFSLTTPEDIMRVINAVNLPSLKMCLDTGHAAMFPDWQPDKSIRTYHDYIKALHVHDNNGREDSHSLPMSRGVIDWSAFAAALRESGFDGVFSFECSPPMALPSPAYEEAMHAHATLGRCLMEL